MKIDEEYRLEKNNFTAEALLTRKRLHIQSMVATYSFYKIKN